MISEYKLKISKGYQLTAPAELRQRYGLKPGDEIKLMDINGELILIPPPKKKGNLKDLIGKYRTKEKINAVEEHDELY